MTSLAMFNQDQEVTMSSREIAEVTGKQHFHVIRDVKKMMKELEKDESKFGCIYLDAYGREKNQYLLPKKLVNCLVMGYSAKLRMAVLDYIEKLEGELKKPQFNLPQTYIEALEHLLESKKENLALAEEIKEKDEHIKVVERRPVLRNQPDCNETSITKIRQKYNKENGLSSEVVDFVIYQFEGGIKSSGSCLIQNEKANGASYKQYLVKDVTKAFNKFLRECFAADLRLTKLAHTQYKCGKPFNGFNHLKSNEMGSLL